MRIERFEQIVAWQKARKLVTAVYELTSKDPLLHDFALRDQLRSAAISIPANTAEGFERSRLREFHQFLSIAKASCAELRTYFYIVGDIGYVSPKQAQTLLAAAEEVARYTGAFRSSIAKQLHTRRRTQDAGLRTQKCS